MEPVVAEPVKALELRRALERRPGRPSALDDKRLAMFFDAVRKGLKRAPAARVCGLNPATVEGWVARGRGRDPLRPARAEYVRFVELLEESEAFAEYTVVANLTEDLKGHPEAAMSWLAMRWPERYKRQWDGGLTDDPESLLQLGRPGEQQAEPEQPTATITETTRTRSIVVPASKLTEFADGIYLTKRGVESAPSLAGLSSGPDDDDSEQDQG